MQGFQLTFYTQQDRQHGHEPLAQWLLAQAAKLGLRGGTLNGALQGLGHDGRTHAVNLFDQSDQPVQVSLVVSAQEAQDLLAHLERERVQIFYVKHAVEFGTTCADAAGSTPQSA